MRTFIGTMMVVLLLACSLQAEQVLFSTDFNEDAVGGQPALAVIDATEPDRIRVVDESVHPFGAAGKHSLQVIKEMENEKTPRVSWKFEDCSKGTLTFKAAMPRSDEVPNPLLSVFLFRNTISHMGPYLAFTPTTCIVRDKDQEKDMKVLPVSWNTEEPFNVKIRFVENNTYSLEINGKPFPDATTRFPFYDEDASPVNTLQFAIADRNIANSRAFVDDVELRSE